LNWSFHDVLREQRLLIASVVNPDMPQKPRLEEALHRWQASQIEAANILKEVMGTGQLARDEQYNPTQILDIQEADSKSFAEEENIVNRRVISHMQEERKRRGLPLLKVGRQSTNAEQAGGCDGEKPSS
jgi:hypothetical protein